MPVTLFGFLKGDKAKGVSPSRNGQADRGILVFENTGEVIQAEKLLKKNGWEIRVMGPPPEIRQGCDLVIEFPLMERFHDGPQSTPAFLAFVMDDLVDKRRGFDQSGETVPHDPRDPAIRPLAGDGLHDLQSMHDVTERRRLDDEQGFRRGNDGHARDLRPRHDTATANAHFTSLSDGSSRYSAALM